MKATHKKVMLLGLSILCMSGLVLAEGAANVDVNDVNEARPDRKPVPKIAHGSPHRSHELLGLPHIDLAEGQIKRIETIVKNNQEGVREVNKALREAEKALQEAKETGRPKLIEIAAINLGQAVGDKAILDISVVQAIKDVLTERQLAALKLFNLKSRVWREHGKLTLPDKPTTEPDASVAATD